MATAAQPGCYLLLVLAQPCAEEHKENILRKVEEGLLSWDVETTKCDLQGIETVCSHLKSSKDVESELLIQHSTENLAVEVLLNPHVSTLKQCLKNLLAANVGHKHVIHAGYAFTGSGSWILQDGNFSYQNLLDTLQDADVQKALQQYPGSTIHVHCIPEGPWAQKDDETSSNVHESLHINPARNVTSVPGSTHLVECLDSVLRFQPLTEMMKSSPVVGNIRFNRPTLYVFPGGQGDCALFGVSGFTMLIDGGFNRKPCFWEFIRHLDRLDAIMVTRLNENNVCGITNVIRRKKEGKRVYPQVGYVFCNVAEGKSPTSPGSSGEERDPLLVSVIREGREFSENLHQLGLKPHRCLRDCLAEPLTLFHKVGHGTLEMHVLSPPKDSKEMKLFFQQWTSYKEHFTAKKYTDDGEMPIPLSHAMSICALLIWKPSDPSDTITRVLLPGSAPQSKIFEGLEHLRHLDELKYKTCSQVSLGIKYEERVKVKTTKKQIMKSSVKHKTDIKRPTSPTKTISDDMKALRRRAESPTKSLTSSPVRKIKKLSKKVDEKKSSYTKDDSISRKSVPKEIKAGKKIKKISRAKAQQLAEDKETTGEEAKMETEDVHLQTEVGELDVIPPAEEEILKVEKNDEMETEEKILLETTNREKQISDTHKTDDTIADSQQIDEGLPEKESLEAKEETVTEQAGLDKEIEDKDEGITLILAEPKKIELEDKSPSDVKEEDKTSVDDDHLRIQTLSPPPEDMPKSPASDKPTEEQKPEPKLKTEKVPKKVKKMSKSSALKSTTTSGGEVRKTRRETEVRKIAKKDKPLEKEIKKLSILKSAKPLPKTLKTEIAAESADKKISELSKPPMKPKESKPIKEIKAPTSLKIAHKAEPRILKSTIEVKSKMAKDVVNKKVAESKLLAKQIQVAKEKVPAALPKSPMKKPKDKLPVMSPKKKMKPPTATPSRPSKPSKDKAKPKPVKRPVKTKEIIPSADETILEEKGPIVPEEFIPSQISSPREEPTKTEMVQEAPSSPREVELEPGKDIDEEISEIPSESVEVKATPSAESEHDEKEYKGIVETPIETKEAEIIDEQMVVKEIEAVEAAVDELIEGMRTEMGESKVKGKLDLEAKGERIDSPVLAEDKIRTTPEAEVPEKDITEEDIFESIEKITTQEEKLSTPEVADREDTWEKLQKEIKPFIQEDISYIKENVKSKGVTLDDYETSIFEYISANFKEEAATPTIESVTKYITKYKVQIVETIYKRYQESKKEDQIVEPQEDEQELSEKSDGEVDTGEMIEPQADELSEKSEEKAGKDSEKEESFTKEEFDNVLTSEIKTDISVIASEIKDIQLDNPQKVITDTIYSIMQEKAIIPTIDSVKNTIIRYRIEIITIIRKLYLTQKPVGISKKETVSAMDKEGEIDINEQLTKETDAIIHELVEEYKSDNMSEEECKTILLTALTEELQKKNLPLHAETIKMYIIENRTIFITILRKKFMSVIEIKQKSPEADKLLASEKESEQIPSPEKAQKPSLTEKEDAESEKTVLLHITEDTKTEKIVEITKTTPSPILNKDLDLGSEERPLIESIDKETSPGEVPEEIEKESSASLETERIEETFIDTEYAAAEITEAIISSEEKTASPTLDKDLSKEQIVEEKTATPPLDKTPAAEKIREKTTSPTSNEVLDREEVSAIEDKSPSPSLGKEIPKGVIDKEEKAASPVLDDDLIEDQISEEKAASPLDKKPTEKELREKTLSPSSDKALIKELVSAIKEKTPSPSLDKELPKEVIDKEETAEFPVLGEDLREEQIAKENAASPLDNEPEGEELKEKTPSPSLDKVLVKEEVSTIKEKTPSPSLDKELIKEVTDIKEKAASPILDEDMSIEQIDEEKATSPSVNEYAGEELKDKTPSPSSDKVLVKEEVSAIKGKTPAPSLDKELPKEVTDIKEKAASPILDEDLSIEQIAEEKTASPSQDKEPTLEELRKKTPSPSSDKVLVTEEVSAIKEKTPSPSLDKELPKEVTDIKEKSASPIVDEELSIEQTEDKAASPSQGKEPTVEELREKTPSPASDKVLIKEKTPSPSLDKELPKEVIDKEEKVTSPVLDKDQMIEQIVEEKAASPVDKEPTGEELREKTLSPSSTDELLLKEVSASKEETPSLDKELAKEVTDKEEKVASPVLDEDLTEKQIAGEKASSTSIDTEPTMEELREKTLSSDEVLVKEVSAIKEKTQSPPLDKELPKEFTDKDEKAASPVLDENLTEEQIAEEKSSSPVDKEPTVEELREKTPSPSSVKVLVKEEVSAIKEKTPSPSLDKELPKEVTDIKEKEASPILDEDLSIEKIADDKAASPSVDKETTVEELREKTPSPSSDKVLVKQDSTVKEKTLSPSLDKGILKKVTDIKEKAASPVLDEDLSEDQIIEEKAASSSVDKEPIVKELIETTLSPSSDKVLIKKEVSGFTEKTTSPSLDKELPKEVTDKEEKAASPDLDEYLSEAQIAKEKADTPVDKEPTVEELREKTPPSSDKLLLKEVSGSEKGTPSPSLDKDITEEVTDMKEKAASPVLDEDLSEEQFDEEKAASPSVDKEFTVGELREKTLSPSSDKVLVKEDSAVKEKTPSPSLNKEIPEEVRNKEEKSASPVLDVNLSKEQVSEERAASPSVEKEPIAEEFREKSPSPSTDKVIAKEVSAIKEKIPSPSVDKEIPKEVTNIKEKVASPILDVDMSEEQIAEEKTASPSADKEPIVEKLTEKSPSSDKVHLKEEITAIKEKTGTPSLDKEVQKEITDKEEKAVSPVLDVDLSAEQVPDEKDASPSVGKESAVDKPREKSPSPSSEKVLVKEEVSTIKEKTPSPSVNKEILKEVTDLKEKAASPVLAEDMSEEQIVEEKAVSASVDIESTMGKLREKTPSPSSDKVLVKEEVGAIKDKTPSPFLNKELPKGVTDKEETASSLLEEDLSEEQTVEKETTSPSIDKEPSKDELNEKTSSPSSDKVLLKEEVSAIKEKTPSPSLDKEIPEEVTDKVLSKDLSVEKEYKVKDLRGKSPSPSSDKVFVKEGVSAIKEKTPSPSVDKEIPKEDMKEKAVSPVLDEDLSEEHVVEKEAASPSVDKEPMVDELKEKTPSPSSDKLLFKGDSEIKEKISSPSLDKEIPKEVTDKKEKISYPVLDVNLSEEQVSEEKAVSPSIEEEPTVEELKEKSPSPSTDKVLTKEVSTIKEKSPSPSVDKEIPKEVTDIKEKAASPVLDEDLSEKQIVEEKVASPSVDKESTVEELRKKTPSPSADKLLLKEEVIAIKSKTPSPSVDKEVKDVADEGGKTAFPTLDEDLMEAKCIEEKMTSPLLDREQTIEEITGKAPSTTSDKVLFKEEISSIEDETLSLSTERELIKEKFDLRAEKAVPSTLDKDSIKKQTAAEVIHSPILDKESTIDETREDKAITHSPSFEKELITKKISPTIHEEHITYKIDKVEQKTPSSPSSGKEIDAENVGKKIQSVYLKEIEQVVPSPCSDKELGKKMISDEKEKITSPSLDKELVEEKISPSLDNELIVKEIAEVEEEKPSHKDSMEEQIIEERTPSPSLDVEAFDKIDEAKEIASSPTLEKERTKKVVEAKDKTTSPSADAEPIKKVDEEKEVIEIVDEAKEKTPSPSLEKEPVEKVDEVIDKTPSSYLEKEHIGKGDEGKDKTPSPSLEKEHIEKGDEGKDKTPSPSLEKEQIEKGDEGKDKTPSPSLEKESIEKVYEAKDKPSSLSLDKEEIKKICEAKEKTPLEKKTIEKVDEPKDKTPSPSLDKKSTEKVDESKEITPSPTSVKKLIEKFDEAKEKTPSPSLEKELIEKIDKAKEKTPSPSLEKKLIEKVDETKDKTPSPSLDKETVEKVDETKDKTPSPTSVKKLIEKFDEAKDKTPSPSLEKELIEKVDEAIDKTSSPPLDKETIVKVDKAKEKTPSPSLEKEPIEKGDEAKEKTPPPSLDKDEIEKFGEAKEKEAIKKVDEIKEKATSPSSEIELIKKRDETRDRTPSPSLEKEPIKKVDEAKDKTPSPSLKKEPIEKGDEAKDKTSSPSLEEEPIGKADEAKDKTPSPSLEKEPTEIVDVAKDKTPSPVIDEQHTEKFDEEKGKDDVEKVDESKVKETIEKVEEIKEKLISPSLEKEAIEKEDETKDKTPSLSLEKEDIEKVDEVKEKTPSPSAEVVKDTISEVKEPTPALNKTVFEEADRKLSPSSEKEQVDEKISDGEKKTPVSVDIELVTEDKKGEVKKSPSPLLDKEPIKEDMVEEMKKTTSPLSDIEPAEDKMMEEKQKTPSSPSDKEPIEPKIVQDIKQTHSPLSDTKSIEEKTIDEIEQTPSPLSDKESAEEMKKIHLPLSDKEHVEEKIVEEMDKTPSSLSDKEIIEEKTIEEIKIKSSPLSDKEHIEEKIIEDIKKTPTSPDKEHITDKVIEIAEEITSPYSDVDSTTDKSIEKMKKVPSGSLDDKTPLLPTHKELIIEKTTALIEETPSPSANQELIEEKVVSKLEKICSPTLSKESITEEKINEIKDRITSPSSEKEIMKDEKVDSSFLEKEIISLRVVKDKSQEPKLAEKEAVQILAEEPEEFETTKETPSEDKKSPLVEDKQSKHDDDLFMTSEHDDKHETDRPSSLPLTTTVTLEQKILGGKITEKVPSPTIERELRMAEKESITDEKGILLSTEESGLIEEEPLIGKATSPMLDKKETEIDDHKKETMTSLPLEPLSLDMQDEDEIEKTPSPALEKKSSEKEELEKDEKKSKAKSPLLTPEHKILSDKEDKLEIIEGKLSPKLEDEIKSQIVVTTYSQKIDEVEKITPTQIESAPEPSTAEETLDTELVRTTETEPKMISSEIIGTSEKETPSMTEVDKKQSPSKQISEISLSTTETRVSLENIEVQETLSEKEVELHSPSKTSEDAVHLSKSKQPSPTSDVQVEKKTDSPMDSIQKEVTSKKEKMEITISPVKSQQKLSDLQERVQQKEDVSEKKDTEEKMLSPREDKSEGESEKLLSPTEPDEEHLSSKSDEINIEMFRESCLKEIKEDQDFACVLERLEIETNFSKDEIEVILHETLCEELNSKGIVISIRSIVKYIMEYKTQIISTISFKLIEKRCKQLGEKSSKEINEQKAAILLRTILEVDDEETSPIAESVMGEEIEIPCKEKYGLHVLEQTTSAEIPHTEEHISPKLVEVTTRKTVYEKPEAEQVFRHIFAETVVEDEVLTEEDIEKEPSSQSSIKEKPISDDVKTPGSPTKKMMYIEIEVEESVTSTTDASPDTDAPEIPFDGKYTESTEIKTPEVSDEKEHKTEGKDYLVEDLSTGDDEFTSAKTSIADRGEKQKIELEESVTSPASASGSHELVTKDSAIEEEVSEKEDSEKEESKSAVHSPGDKDAIIKQEIVHTGTDTEGKSSERADEPEKIESEEIIPTAIDIQKSLVTDKASLDQSEVLEIEIKDASVPTYAEEIITEKTEIKTTAHLIEYSDDFPDQTQLKETITTEKEDKGEKGTITKTATTTTIVCSEETLTDSETAEFHPEEKHINEESIPTESPTSKTTEISETVTEVTGKSSEIKIETEKEISLIAKETVCDKVPDTTIIPKEKVSASDAPSDSSSETKSIKGADEGSKITKTTITTSVTKEFSPSDSVSSTKKHISLKMEDEKEKIVKEKITTSSEKNDTCFDKTSETHSLTEKIISITKKESIIATEEKKDTIDKFSTTLSRSTKKIEVTDSEGKTEKKDETPLQELAAEKETDDRDISAETVCTTEVEQPTTLGKSDVTKSGDIVTSDEHAYDDEATIAKTIKDTEEPSDDSKIRTDKKVSEITEVIDISKTTGIVASDKEEIQHSEELTESTVTEVIEVDSSPVYEKDGDALSTEKTTCDDIKKSDSSETKHVLQSDIGKKSQEEAAVEKHESEIKEEIITDEKMGDSTSAISEAISDVEDEILATKSVTSTYIKKELMSSSDNLGDATTKSDVSTILEKATADETKTSEIRDISMTETEIISGESGSITKITEKKSTTAEFVLTDEASKSTLTASAEQTTSKEDVIALESLDKISECSTIVSETTSIPDDESLITKTITTTHVTKELLPTKQIRDITETVDSDKNLVTNTSETDATSEIEADSLITQIITTTTVITETQSPAEASCESTVIETIKSSEITTEGTFSDIREIDDSDIQQEIDKSTTDTTSETEPIIMQTITTTYTTETQLSDEISDTSTVKETVKSSEITADSKISDIVEMVDSDMKHVVDKSTTDTTFETEGEQLVTQTTTTTTYVTKTQSPGELRADETVIETVKSSETTTDDTTSDITEIIDSDRKRVIDKSVSDTISEGEPLETRTITTTTYVTKIQSPGELSTEGTVIETITSSETTTDDTIGKDTEIVDSDVKHIVDETATDTADETEGEQLVTRTITTTTYVTKTQSPGESSADEILIKTIKSSETTTDDTAIDITEIVDSDIKRVVDKSVSDTTSEGEPLGTRTITTTYVTTIQSPGELSAEGIVIETIKSSETTTDDTIGKVTEIVDSDVKPIVDEPATDTTFETEDGQLVTQTTTTTTYVTKTQSPGELSAEETVIETLKSSETTTDDTASDITEIVDSDIKRVVDKSVSDTTSAGEPLGSRTITTTTSVTKIQSPDELGAEGTVTEAIKSPETTTDYTFSEVTEVVDSDVRHIVEESATDTACETEEEQLVTRTITTTTYVTKAQSPGELSTDETVIETVKSSETTTDDTASDNTEIVDSDIKRVVDKSVSDTTSEGKPLETRTITTTTSVTKIQSPGELSAEGAVIERKSSETTTDDTISEVTEIVDADMKHIVDESATDTTSETEGEQLVTRTTTTTTYVTKTQSPGEMSDGSTVETVEPSETMAGGKIGYITEKVESDMKHAVDKSTTITTFKTESEPIVTRTITTTTSVTKTQSPDKVSVDGTVVEIVKSSKTTTDDTVSDVVEMEDSNIKHVIDKTTTDTTSETEVEPLVTQTITTTYITKTQSSDEINDTSTVTVKSSDITVEVKDSGVAETVDSDMKEKEKTSEVCSPSKTVEFDKSEIIKSTTILKTETSGADDESITTRVMTQTHATKISSPSETIKKELTTKDGETELISKQVTDISTTSSSETKTYSTDDGSIVTKTISSIKTDYQPSEELLDDSSSTSHKSEADVSKTILETISQSSTTHSKSSMEEETESHSEIFSTIKEFSEALQPTFQKVEDSSETLDKQESDTKSVIIEKISEKTEVTTISGKTGETTMTEKTTICDKGDSQKSIKSEIVSTSEQSLESERVESKSEKIITESDKSNMESTDGATVERTMYEHQVSEESEHKSFTEDSLTKTSTTMTSSEGKYEESAAVESIKSSEEKSVKLVSSEIKEETSSFVGDSSQILTSTTVESQELHEDKSSEDIFIEMQTTKIIPESSKQEISPHERTPSEGESAGDSSTKKRRSRKVVKKIILCTDTEASADDVFTEERIQEAIKEAVGKSKSPTSKIISMTKTTTDLDSLTSQTDVIEIKSRSETPTTHSDAEDSKEGYSFKAETTSEGLEHIAVDPFSLITKPIEETFRKKMLEQTNQQQTTQITKESVKEKMSEKASEKDEDTSQNAYIDPKVATDAKKLVMGVRSATESSDVHQPPPPEQAQASSSISAERTASDSRREQAESDGEKDKESFTLDEWDKPMGLPSPPEPLDFNPITKQNTTRSTKQEGNYKNPETVNTAVDEAVSYQNGQQTFSTTEDTSPKEDNDTTPEKESQPLHNKESDKSVEPIYLDLTYVPHFGDPHYSNVEFFRRIRSRYYVFSGTKPSKEVFNALLEAKQDWKDKEAKVTIIPTYETDTLGYWMTVNQDALIANNIDVAPSASRCTINLQDHETSCSAYRLEL